MTKTKTSPKATAGTKLIHPRTVKTAGGFSVTMANAFTDEKGRQREIGFVEMSVDFCLRWLKHNQTNRPFNWGHAWTLCQNFRELWVGEANLYVMDWTDNVADGQHRPSALILARGTREQVAELLRLRNVPGNEEGDKGKEPGNYAAGKPLPVPIRDWKLADPEEVWPTIVIPVVVGANPLVGDKADTDQRQRNGADQLARHQDSANQMAAMGIDGNLYQRILRFMYLRTLPATQKQKDNGAHYGSMKKGGNIHPDRYPTFAKVFGPFVAQAHEILTASKADYDITQMPLLRHQLYGSVALALQGGIERKRIEAFLRAWTPHPDSRGNLVLSGVAKTVAADLDDGKILTEYHRAYLISRLIQETDHCPDIRTPDRIKKFLDGEEGKEGYEQNKANRLPGWDQEGCKQVWSKALVNKINSEAKQARERKAREEEAE